VPPPSGQDCEVWPENWNALLLFLACQTQWEISIGMGGAHYMPARSVNVELEYRWLKLERAKTATVIAQYRDIERHAMSICNERANKQS